MPLRQVSTKVESDFLFTNLYLRERGGWGAMVLEEFCRVFSSVYPREVSGIAISLSSTPTAVLRMEVGLARFPFLLN